MTGSDGDLIARVRAGDREAFDRLAEAHARRIFSIALGVLDSAEEAQDVTQDVLVILYRTLRQGGLRRPEALPAWLGQVCVNRCREIMRGRRREEPPAEAVTADPAAGPEQRFASGELRLALRQAVMGLPRRQRQVFVLRHFAGLSTDEVARVLRCAPATVRVHLYRAMAALREILAEGGKGDA